MSPVYTLRIVIEKEDAVWIDPEVANDVIEGFSVRFHDADLVGQIVAVKPSREAHLIPKAPPVQPVIVAETSKKEVRPERIKESKGTLHWASVPG